jgi:hypothetical protein
MSELEIVITPSAVQYEQLVSDLETLRDLGGAGSNTGAIIAAVRSAACEYDARATAAPRRRTNAPGQDTRR